MPRRQVDFPDPLGPMIATLSPAATSKLTPLSTGRLPKRFCRPVTLRRGTVSAIVPARTVQKSRWPVRNRAIGLGTASALLAAGRNPICRTIDAVAWADGPRREPSIPSHAVSCADFPDFAVGPQFPQDRVHVFGQLGV